MNEHILIVDDNTRNVEALAAMLAGFNYVPHYLLSGDKVVESAVENRYDLILLDIMMPGVDGYEVCRRLKTNEKTGNIPVIFITGKSDSESISEAFNAGAVDYLVKPVNSIELQARIKTHLNLRNREEELEKANAAKDRFLSILSHDLRNPFQNILGGLDLLIEDIIESGLTEQNSRLLDTVYAVNESAEKAYGLLENLLQWSRLHRGRIKFQPENFCLQDLLKNAVDVVHSEMTRKNINLNLQTEKCNIYADSNMLLLVVRNLLSNAVKFTDHGGSITLVNRATEESCIIEVADSGRGMSEVQTGKLFKIEDHFSTAGTEGEKGTGMGLILVNDFVKEHNGTIQVESRPGEGTLIAVEIPQNY